MVLTGSCEACKCAPWGAALRSDLILQLIGVSTWCWSIPSNCSGVFSNICILYSLKSRRFWFWKWRLSYHIFLEKIFWNLIVVFVYHVIEWVTTLCKSSFLTRCIHLFSQLSTFSFYANCILSSRTKACYFVTATSSSKVSSFHVDLYAITERKKVKVF